MRGSARLPLFVPQVTWTCARPPFSLTGINTTDVEALGRAFANDNAPSLHRKKIDAQRGDEGVSVVIGDIVAGGGESRQRNGLPRRHRETRRGERLGQHRQVRPQHPNPLGLHHRLGDGDSERQHMGRLEGGGPNPQLNPARAAPRRILRQDSTDRTPIFAPNVQVGQVRN